MNTSQDLNRQNEIVSQVLAHTRGNETASKAISDAIRFSLEFANLVAAHQSNYDFDWVVDNLYTAAEQADLDWWGVERSELRSIVEGAAQKGS